MGTAALSTGSGEMSGSGGWWRRKSTPAKVETYTRWSFHFFALIELVSVSLPLFGALPLWLALSLALLVAVHSVACAVTAARALDWTLGSREQPVHMLWMLGALTAAVAVAAIVVAEHGPGGDDVDTAAGSVFAVVLIFGAGTSALGVRSRRRMYSVVTGFAVGAGIVSFAGRPTPTAVISVLVVFLGGGFLAFTSAFSVWLLNAVYELDEARETRARLAVAEERLRFGRDLHDVMGRNLAVIALKSELAVQLARRGRPEAEEQMVEVQRIAQESQREVRDVVRGYREADLGSELTGAQGVLEAAGIACVFAPAGGTAALPSAVQSALGWVVREATTNVLRHGDAGRCAVDVRVGDEHVVLTVENDGVVAAPGPGGSGLAGLRERLAAVDGTLEAGPVGDGMFRVVASVPLRVSEVTA